MIGINKVIILGCLGQEPEIRTTTSGNRIANLSVATSETWKDKATGERKERTEWHRVVVFNSAFVGICDKYLHKGSKVYIEGQLQTRSWKDNNGVEKYTTEIVLQNYSSVLAMLDSKPADSQTQAPVEQIPVAEDDDFEDAIPF